MADSIRIDEMIFDTSGRVRVRYTRGTAPLPIDPAGNEVEFVSKADFGVAMDEPNMNDQQMLILACAPTYKAAPTMPNPGAYKNKTFTLDTSGAVATAAWT